MSRNPSVSRPRLVTPSFVLVGVATLAYFLGESAVFPVLPVYVRGPLGGDDIAVGLSVGAFSITALLIRPWAGRLADRRGRRLPMVIGSAIFAASVAGYLLADSVPLLVAMRLLTGVGEAFVFTGAASAIADMAPEERRGEAISFFSLALWTGIAIGPLIGELAIHAGGFSLVWLIAAGFGLVAGGLALAVRTPSITSAEEGPVPSLVNRRALLPGTTLLLSIWGASGFFAFVPLFARELGLGGSKFVFMLFSGTIVVIRLFGARIPDVFGSVRVARFSFVVSAVGLVTMGLWGTAAGLFVGTAVFAVGQALAFPALMALALEGAPARERGSVVATFTAFVDIGFGVGPAALGFVAHAGGYGATFLTGSAVALVGLGLLVSRYRGRT